MRRGAGWLPVAAALCAVASALPAAGLPALEVVGAHGSVLARLPLGEGRAFCLHWRHSVTGGPVADCFRIDAATGGDGAGEPVLLLTDSHLHDFAAGLGHLPGRGRQVAAPGGGYRIEAIDEPVPQGRLSLRVGAVSTAHRIEAGGQVLDLSALAAGQRVILRPAVD